MTDDKPVMWALSLHRVVDGKPEQLHVRYAEGEPWTAGTRIVGFSGNSETAFLAAVADLWRSTMNIARAGNLQEVLPQEAEEELAK